MIELVYHKNQRKIFEDKARFKIIAKGRRFGLTKGFANYVIEKMLNTETELKVLWVDTIYLNIERYFERYFMPVLKQLDKRYWEWKQIKNYLRIFNNICEFRSADRPENMEGFGYNLIIINEAGIVLKKRKIWEETIQPMMLDYKAECIIGGTPKGKRYKNQTHLFYELFNNDEWKKYQFTTFDNPLLEKEEVERLAKEMNISLRSQEIFGEFIDENFYSIIKKDWFGYYSTNDAIIKKNYGVYASWDTAFKINQENDYSVCIIFQITENNYLIKSIFRERLEFPDLKRKVIEIAEKYKVNEIIIEDHASGQSLIQELKRETRLPIKAIRKDKDKISYVNAIAPILESKKVLINEEIDQEVIKNFLYECEEFPNSEYDDQVDALSQFLNYARTIENKRIEVITKKLDRKKYY